MKKEDIKKTIEKQKKFFYSNYTLDVNNRINALKRLKEVIKKNEEKIFNALYLDLGKSREESYMCEVGLALDEIGYMIKKTKKLSKNKKVKTPISQFYSRSFIKKSPYGTVLIISPWNYPFLLTISPLADAIAAGNTAIVKPSAYSPNTSKAIYEILSEVFDNEYVATILGGREENQFLLDEKFDYIFFTGSQNVGKYVMERASKFLTPITLELGGKSPCIIDASADVKISARRVVFGKYLNCGQTCVAPDYVLCHSSIKDKFIEEVKKEIEIQFTSNPLNYEKYGKIINEKHYNRIINLIDKNKVIYGGKYENQKIEPTVMDNVNYDDLVMSEEIFGPVMPIISFNNIDEIIQKINTGNKPLALYIFSDNKDNINKVISQCQFGGGCINDTVVHLATHNMAFGGVGESGMGAYHGEVGFDTFSHKKSILDKKNFIDLPMRYQPYNNFKDTLIRMFVK